VGAQQIEALLVFAACAAYGVVLISVDAERLPPLLRVKPANRMKWGVCLILLGVVMSIHTVLGGS
jgi:hypothetical protein